jgi:hypothetical protein
MAGASPSVLQGKIDVALSQFARQYRNNNLVADFLFPRVEVLKQQDYYWTFGRENQKLAENALRGPGSAAERIAQTISKTLYKAQDHSLARVIPDEERSNFMAGDVEQWATQARSWTSCCSIARTASRRSPPSPPATRPATS